MSILKDIYLVQPEVILSIGILVSLIVDILSTRDTRWLVPLFSILTLGITGFYVITNFYNEGEAFKMLTITSLGRAFDIAIIAGALITTLLAWDRKGEHHFLLLSATLGAMILVKSISFISFILALEMFSFAIIGQIALSKDSLGIESAMKFFILSVIASSFIILGIATVYSIFGTFYFPKIFLETTFRPLFQAKPLYFVASFVLIMVGIAFKLSAVPFHFWTPEVFRGAHSSVGGYIATVSKTSAFGFLVNFLYIILGNVPYIWGELLVWLGAITMFVGNMAALAENDIKRMLGYSTIAHAGYIMVAFGIGTDTAVGAAIFYLVIYTLMTLGAFAVVNSIGEDRSSFEYYKGLSREHGIQAFLLLIFMVSLAGIPPTAGFVGKFYLFSEVVKAGEYLLAIWAFINGVISTFYYIRPVFYAYGFEPRYKFESSLNPAIMIAFIVGFVGVIYLGLAPSGLLGFISSAFTH